MGSRVFQIARKWLHRQAPWHDILSIMTIMNIDPVKWQAPPKELSLKAGEVHVWLIHTPVQDFLDVDEQVRAEKFISPLHRQRFKDAHNGLREILAKYVHQSPKEIIFTKTNSGKPLLKHFPELHFNLSHSEDIALCAISKNPVGIDVEYLDKKINFLDIAQRFFNNTEYDILKAITDKEKLNLAFFKLWTQKEAYLKSQGKGVSAGLDIEIPREFLLQHFIPAHHHLAAVGGTTTSQILYFLVERESREQFL